MRLKEVFIRRYGPISGLHLRLASGLQPIYGLNESGKTLVIDALIKRLIGLEVGSDPLLDRVEETPEGYIVLEDKGQEIKLGENETLATYLAIEPDELRNVFVVRDADLRIASEDIFYNRVTDKITGLRLEDIRKIKEQLRDSGKLTEGLKISDTATHSKAKSQLELAEKLKNDVEQYIEKAKSEHLEKLEADVFEANIRKSQLESHLELLEKAKKKTDFQKLKDELESAQSSLSESNKIPEEAFQSLGKKLTLYEVSENKLPHFSRAREFFQKLSYLLSIGSFAAFVSLSLLQKLDAISLIIPSILLILTAISITQWLRASHELSEAEQNRASLLREATTAGLEIKDISSLRKSLNVSDAAIIRLRDDLNQKLGVLKKDLKIELIIPQEILKKSAEKLGVIKGEIDQSVNIGYSQEDYEQTRSELAKLEERLKDVGEALEKHLRTIEDLANRANKLKFLVFLNRELDLQIKNLDSLKQLIPQLDELEAKIIEDVQLAMDSLKLFDILEEEEKAKVASLFKEGNLASQLFSKTTNGRYSEVKYDHEKEEIIVTRPTGETFQAQKLSKGTRDQLYFSIRVALGQILLEGTNGFFITDDAFVSSDDKRIKQQIDLLKTISEMGWQIIYFSAKKGAIDMLSKVTQNKIITLQPLP
jgi:hypothetical protein